MKDNEEIISIISNKDIEALKEWINKGGNVKTIIQKPVSRLSLIQFLINEIDDEINEDDDIYLKMLEILIRNGADINYFDEACNSPVSDLISLNKPKLLKFILGKGANVNFTGAELETPLIVVALDQNIELMSLLLPYASEDFINKPGSYHAKTPLGLAFYFGNLEMIELLLKYKADPYVNDGEGYLTIESIPEDIDEDLKKEIFNLIDKYKA